MDIKMRKYLKQNTLFINQGNGTAKHKSPHYFTQILFNFVYPLRQLLQVSEPSPIDAHP